MKLEVLPISNKLPLTFDGEGERFYRQSSGQFVSDDGIALDDELVKKVFHRYLVNATPWYRFVEPDGYMYQTIGDDIVYRIKDSSYLLPKLRDVALARIPDISTIGKDELMENLRALRQDVFKVQGQSFFIEHDIDDGGMIQLTLMYVGVPFTNPILSICNIYDK
jgi:hypothetical protein